MNESRWRGMVLESGHQATAVLEVIDSTRVTKVVMGNDARDTPRIVMDNGLAIHCTRAQAKEFLRAVFGFSDQGSP